MKLPIPNASRSAEQRGTHSLDIPSCADSRPPPLRSGQPKPPSRLLRHLREWILTDRAHEVAPDGVPPPHPAPPRGTIADSFMMCPTCGRRQSGIFLHRPLVRSRVRPVRCLSGRSGIVRCPTPATDDRSFHHYPGDGLGSVPVGAHAIKAGNLICGGCSGDVATAAEVKAAGNSLLSGRPGW